MKTRILLATAILATSLARSGAITVSTSDIIPRPAATVSAKSEFIIPAEGFSVSIKGDSNGNLARYITSQAPLFNMAGKAGKASLTIDITGNGQPESYTMKITPKRISVKAASETGAFYALQSLLQMASTPGATAIQCATVTDTPRFPYRGLLFDVSRHFRSTEFLKKQIDAMAMMKLNRLHLHFTDAAGWRMEVAKYPRLTEFAAWRPQAVWQDWTDNGAQYCEASDSRAYGGFYTANDLRDLVDYAAARHITIIPEIEVPGHSKEVTSAYPGLSCSGIPYTDEDLCIGKEATFKFIENVLDEVMDIFPSTLIHIGGDEAAKTGWRNCPDCKERMEQEGLENVDQLQSYAIERVEKYLNSKGRHIIGWDEIMEGGLAPNATVMSWRGTQAGIDAIKAGHDVIMTPGEYCYIDYTQDAAFKEPISIGGYTPLAKVYSYEPVDSSLTAAEASHLLGVQANLWTEYIPTDSHAEYMYYPRAFAIAEIGWSTPEKDYTDFRRRALSLNSILDSARYTTFNLKDEFGERRESFDPVTHNAIGASVSYITQPHSKYPAAGKNTLVDGLRGGWTYGDKRWQGFLGDFEAVIDLGRTIPVNNINTTFMHAPGAWVHLPSDVTFELSADGRTYTPAGTVWSDVDPLYPKIMMRQFSVYPGKEARYVKIKAKGHDRPGAWLFIDEIVVN